MVDTASEPSGQRPEHDEVAGGALEPRRDAPLGAQARHAEPKAHLEPATPLRLDSDRDLSRVGFWLLLLGGLSAIVGITFLLAGGILPGALVAALGLLCALVGALALMLVAHHQG